MFLIKNCHVNSNMVLTSNFQLLAMYLANKFNLYTSVSKLNENNRGIFNLLIIINAIKKILKLCVNI